MIGQGYVIIHRESNTRVGYTRTIAGARMGWDCTPGGDYIIKLEADWKKERA